MQLSACINTPVVQCVTRRIFWPLPPIGLVQPAVCFGSPALSTCLTLSLLPLHLPLLLLLQGACPNIKYHQYVIASTICITHHRALSVFFGRSMPSLAELFSGGPNRDVRVAIYRFVSGTAGARPCDWNLLLSGTVGDLG